MGDIAGGLAACGASTTFVYRCRDGDRRIGGRWQRFNTRCREGGGSQGSYNEGDEITLEFHRQRKTLCVSDAEGPCHQPLTESLPVDDEDLHFCVDTFEADQGATIVSSCFVES